MVTETNGSNLLTTLPLVVMYERHGILYYLHANKEEKIGEKCNNIRYKYTFNIPQGKSTQGECLISGGLYYKTLSQCHSVIDNVSFTWFQPVYFLPLAIVHASNSLSFQLKFSIYVHHLFPFSFHLSDRQFVKSF